MHVSVTGLRAGKGILAEYAKQYRESLLRIVDEQPTAYDVEKVVAALEETRWTTIFDTSCIFENDKLDKCIKIVNELAEEHKGGWIPCSERLPDKRDWYLAVFQEADTGFIGLPFIADYLMGVHTKYTTEDGWIIANCTDIEEGRAEYYKKLKCVAWQPLPGKYIPKGEQ